ncbi:MAG: DUF554 domain-containing protein [Clostridia bacterium]|nr:DUF554 domain-containing protein [Clostridia bacterium]
MLWGTIVNVIAIICGSILGTFLKGGLPEKYKNIVIQAVSLSVVIIGITMAIKSQNILIVIISLIIGGIIGELLKIEDRLQGIGEKIQSKFSGKGDGRFVQGFITATLIYCVGAMAIMGALQSGLEARHDILYAKSMLDGITAIIFSSTMGIGVAFSAGPVLLYEGAIVLASSGLKAYMSDVVILEMAAVGGILIVGIGITMLDIKKINVGNMLPAIFIPLIYSIVKSLI